MRNINNYRFNLIFNNIAFLLDEKPKSLNDNSRYYISEGTEFFNNLLGTLSNLDRNKTGNDNNQRSFYFIPGFRDIVRLNKQHNDLPEKRININEMVKYFKNIKRKIKMLDSNPQAVYDDPEIEDMKQLIKAIASLYHKNTNVTNDNRVSFI